MPASRSSSKRRSTGNRRQGLNRAQLQAMEARAAATPAEAVVPRDPVPGAKRAPARTGRRTINRVYAITREAEYRYIRSDMRRLILVAAGLLVLMLVLLLILD